MWYNPYKLLFMKKNTRENHVNEKIVRIVAAQVVLFTILLLLTNWKILALFLVVDFTLRVFTKTPSLMVLNAKGISKSFKLIPKPIFAPPKRFATTLGLLISILMALFMYFDLTTGAYAVGGILILFAAMEAFLNICIGCYIYNWIIAPFNKN